MNKQLIFLCGFMGCGKSTHGKKLAKLLGYSFIDLDHYIEEKEKSTVTELFKLKGEQEFRKMESESLQSIIDQKSKCVIALGGGTPCFNNNIDFIKANGVMAYIKMDAKALFNRLKNASGERPLLQGKTDEELLIYISDLLSKREQFYNQAHVCINGINLTDHILKQRIESQTSQ